jgi:pyridoxine 5-phosphate synthase
MTMRLAVNVDHFATLREARKSNEPDPVLAALLAEQSGASGIVCHIRSDRRHIKERDLRLLRETVKTRLIVEMAATEEMKSLALDINPDIISLVPENENELTTEGGLDVITHRKHLTGHIRELQDAGLEVSIFVDPDSSQIRTCEDLGARLIEINTGKYAELSPGLEQDKALAEIARSVELGAGLGLEVHAGHGLDYRNILPVAVLEDIKEFSIGFSIVARSAMVGIELAVEDMLALVE